MDTMVIQSSRTEDQPAWIATCLASATAWANLNGWDYCFRGDDLFDLVPPDLRAKFPGQIPLQIDIARLLWARSLFAEISGIERIIWLDADVFISAPETVQIDPALDFAVGRQIWVQPDQNEKLRSTRQVHNAILVFTRPSPVLDFLIQTVVNLATRHAGAAAPQFLGPKLLTALHNIVGFAVIESVGMASPLVLRDLAAGGGPALDLLTTKTEDSLGALNLCSSYQGQTIDGVACTDSLFENAITTLKNTRW